MSTIESGKIILLNGPSSAGKSTLCRLSKPEVAALPGQLWQDLDALLRLMGIELEERKEAKCKKLRSDLEMVEG